MKANRARNAGELRIAKRKATSTVVAQLVRIARKDRLGYDDFLSIS